MSMRTWTDEEKEIGEEFMFAVSDENGTGDCQEIRRLILENPWLVSDYDWTGAETWLSRAASDETAKSCRFIVRHRYTPKNFNAGWSPGQSH